MKSLKNQDDIQSTAKAMEKAQSWYLSIPDQKTPWRLLSLDYSDGYVHWYDIGGGARRIVCAGGLEGKGFATSVCPICAYVLEQYQEAKRLLDEGDEAKSIQVKNRANRLHGKPEVQFKALRGQRTLLKTKLGKEWVADFDLSDEESTSAVGIISLSESQFSGITGLIHGSGTEFIKTGDDLERRVLWSTKEHRKGKTGGKYSAVVWSADSAESAMPDIEIPSELADMDLTTNFTINNDEIDKVFSAISGQTLEEPEADDPVSMEKDSEKKLKNSDLDDLADDEDPDPEIDLEFEDDDPTEAAPPARPQKIVGRTATVPPKAKAITDTSRSRRASF